MNLSAVPWGRPLAAALLLLAGALAVPFGPWPSPTARAQTQNGDVAKTHTVTADRAIFTATQTVTTRADAIVPLGELILVGFPLSARFDPAVTEYAATVRLTDDEETLIALPADPSHTVEYLDGSDAPLADADAETDGQQLALDVGENVVKVKVSESEGNSQTYTFAITRNPVKVEIDSGDRLTVSWNDPHAAGCDNGYKVYWNFGGTGRETSADQTTNPGSWSAPEGDFLTNGYQRVGVSCGDPDSGRAVGEEKPVHDRMKVASLSLSRGALTPAFDDDITSYIADVDASVSKVTMTANLNWPAGSIGLTNVESGFKKDFPGSAESWVFEDVPLAVGDNFFTIESGCSSSDCLATFAHSPAYYLRVRRAASAVNDATLSALSLTDLDGVDVELDPAFDGGTQDTAAEVDLDVGDTAIDIVVTAEDESTKTYTVTVTRAKPTVTIGVGATTASEGDALTFTVTRDGSPDEALTVTVDVAETGDLVPVANEGAKTVTILANDRSATLTVQTDPDDNEWDSHSTVTATLQPNAAYTPTSNTAVSTEVEDDDFPAATAVLSVDPATVAENAGPVTATVTFTTNADQQPHAGRTVTLTTSDGAATTPADYGALSTSHTFSAGDFQRVDVGGGTMRYRAVKISNVSIVDDSDDEDAEDFTITMAVSADFALATLGTSSATATITDNDLSSDATLSGLSLSEGTLPPSFTSGHTSYTAGVGYGVTEVTVTPTVSDAGKAHYSVDGGTQDTGAEVDLDVGANTMTVTVTAEDESTQAYTITITRAKPTVTISRGAPAASEGDALTFTVTRDGSPDEALTVTVDVTESQDVVSAANESSKRVTIPANSALATLTVQTAPGDDTWNEHSTVVVTVVTNAVHDRGSPHEAETLVEDDDFPAATAELSVAPATVDEGGTVTATVTVTTTRAEEPHKEGGGLAVANAGGTASSGDYAPTYPTVSFARTTFAQIGGGDERYQASFDVTITIVDDMTIEDAETIELKLERVAAPATDTQIMLSSQVQTVVINASAAPASSDATLSSLTLSGVSFTFASATEDYAIKAVAASVTTTTVTPTAATGANYAIYVEGETVSDDITTDTAKLNMPRDVTLHATDDTVITVAVRSGDGSATNAYTVRLERDHLGASYSPPTMGDDATPPKWELEVHFTEATSLATNAPAVVKFTFTSNYINASPVGDGDADVDMDETDFLATDVVVNNGTVTTFRELGPLVVDPSDNEPNDLHSAAVQADRLERAQKQAAHMALTAGTFYKAVITPDADCPSTDKTPCVVKVDVPAGMAKDREGVFNRKGR